MELETALARFDGKHTAALKEAVEIAKADRRGRLEAICARPGLAVAATWVVKALLEHGDGGHLDMVRVFRTLCTAEHWEAQLHLLQSVQFAPVAAMEEVEAVRELLSAKKTLVRVWALDALVRIAVERRELRAEVVALVQEALHGTAASLRARARALDVICAGWK